MTFPYLISKKRDGHELLDEDIHAFVSGVQTGAMSESQIGAMLMAMYCRGLTEREIATLTQAMKESGDTLDWPNEWKDLLVDKHSTGGVGDKISLVLAPALAVFGVKVPMISGRGLAHTGGTLDKLEAIPGYRVALTGEEMVDILSKVGCFIAGQTADICPVDKKTYAIRDVTATVGDIGLITASIVSKKAAENIQALVLDVKTGTGALMKNEDEASTLAESMLSCCKLLGIKAAVLLTDMNDPIGNMVGNALEVIEAIQCLKGQGPEDLLNLTLSLGGHLLDAAGHAGSFEEASSRLRQGIESGEALAKFCAMLKLQGVEENLADRLCHPDVDPRTLLPQATFTTTFQCSEDGYIQNIEAMGIAEAVHMLGAGRNIPGEAINWAVGIELLLKPGDQVVKGQDWVKVHHDQPLSAQITEKIINALEISKDPVEKKTTRVLRVMK